MTPHTSGSRGKALALCCEYQMSFVSLFTEIRRDGASTVSSHPIACVCVTQAQAQTRCGINTDLCLVPAKHSLLIGCACITDNYLRVCMKGYSERQITFEATISHLGTLADSTLESTELRFLKFGVFWRVEHQLS